MHPEIMTVMTMSEPREKYNVDTRACGHCEGAKKRGLYGWWCPDCQTYEPDHETDKMTVALFEDGTPDSDIVDEIERRKEATIESALKRLQPELGRCPFCDGETKYSKPTTYTSFFFKCAECQCLIAFPIQLGETEAITAFNRRPATDADFMNQTLVAVMVDILRDHAADPDMARGEVFGAMLAWLETMGQGEAVDVWREHNKTM